MSFISFEFVALLLLSFIAFHATPARHRKYVMLTASCAFIAITIFPSCSQHWPSAC